jgi:glycosyltransferase involved in cell wall biosynthesis
MMDEMRIGWVTPFNERSAIGVYALGVVRELRKRGVEASIIRAEVGAAARLPPLSDSVPVCDLDEAAPNPNATPFDLFVVTIADHFQYNRRSLDILRTVPAVGLFHDADVRHLVLGMADASGMGLDAVDRLRSVGATARRSGSLFGEDLAWIASLCAGAICHSSHYARPLAEYCPGPTIRLPLCFDDPGSPPRRRQDGEFTIVTFGNLNANKQVDRVMRAVASSRKLSSRTVYRLVGHIEPRERERLLALARELRVPAPIFEGRLSDDRLQEALGQAHALCCLRYPIVEGGSGSLIYSLYSGTPVVISDAGAYSDVPTDLAWKVSYGEEVQDVRQALEDIVEDQGEADQRAGRGREWAVDHFSVANYVDYLIPFLERCLAAAPVIAGGRVLGQSIADLGLSTDDPAVDRLGIALDELFSKVVAFDNNN